MQKNGSVYTLFVAASLIGAPVLRLFSVLYLSYVCAGIYAALALFGAVLMSADALKVKRYARAFEFKNPFRLDIFSYIASSGFFVSFVTQCVLLAGELSAKRVYPEVVFTSIMTAVCAIVSCGYFVIVGLSFSGGNYDFRAFKFIHIFPMLWAVSNVFCLFELSGGFEKSIDSILMFLSSAALICFFYFFALEADSDKGARRETVLFSRLAAYFSLLFFFDRLILVLSKHAELNAAENSFALTAILLCGFIFFFEKNILNNYLSLKNTES